MRDAEALKQLVEIVPVGLRRDGALGIRQEIMGRIHNLLEGP